MAALRALLAVLLLSFTVTACGDDAGRASAQDILAETFSNEQRVDSGVLDLAVRVDATGTEQAQGPVRIDLDGPFQSRGEGKLPAFAFKASVNGLGGVALTGGLTSTGDEGFVSFMGTDYAIPAEQWEQLTAKAGKDGGGGRLSTLGIDPRAWVRDAEVAGQVDVGGTETDRITGTIDVAKLLEDLDAALAKAAPAGAAGGAPLPARLTDRQRKEVSEAVRSARVEIFSGSDDRLLRRMLVTLELVSTPTTKDDFDTAKVVFDLQLTALNEDQTITAPRNTKPLSELLSGFSFGP